MSRKYRLFGKIPVVDILIVLVLVAFLGGAIWLLTREEVQEQTGAEAQDEVYPFTAVLLVNNTPSRNASLVTVGDKLYLKGGTYVGTVTDVRVEPYRNYGVDSVTGEYVGTVMNGRSNLYISIDGEAMADSSKGIYINKKRIAYGNRHDIGNEKYCWSMTIVEVRSEGDK